VEYDEYQVIVVRARRDGGRLIARILTGSNPTVPARQWVFADVGEVCALIERLLQELDGSAPPGYRQCHRGTTADGGTYAGLTAPQTRVPIIGPRGNQTEVGK
jgi:hypothetical protein